MHKKNIILSVGIALILTTIFVWVREEKRHGSPEFVKDWQTYTNQELGFEFKYPKEWTVSEGHRMSSQATTIELRSPDNLNSISIGDWPSCNPEEIMSEPKPKCVFKGRSITTFSEDKDVLTVFNGVVSSFIEALELNMADWKTYRNEKYGFEFQYPADWNVEEKIPQTGLGDYPLFIVSDPQNSSHNLTSISIYPNGYPGDSWTPASGKSVKSKIHFREGVTEAEDFVLENGEVWLTYAHTPQGFLLARLEVKDLQEECIDKGEIIDRAICNSYYIDQPELIMSGHVDYDNRVKQVKVLESLDFTASINSVTPTSGSVGSKVVIKGGNLETVLQQGGVWIEDAEENRGKGFIALQSKESNSSQIVVTIPASAPRQISAPQGVALKTPFEITPGKYNLFLGSDTDTASKVEFVVKEDVSWKVYKNERFGFEFAYPSGWILSTKSESEIQLTKANGNDLITISYLARPKSTVETDDVRYIQGVVEDEDAKFGHIAYFFNEQEGKWKKTPGDENSPDLTVGDADMSLSANSGLPIFVGKRRWLTYIVPLTKITFLKLNISGSGATVPLYDIAKTVKNIGTK